MRVTACSSDASCTVAPPARRTTRRGRPPTSATSLAMPCPPGSGSVGTFNATASVTAERAASSGERDAPPARMVAVVGQRDVDRARGAVLAEEEGEKKGNPRQRLGHSSRTD